MTFIGCFMLLIFKITLASCFACGQTISSCKFGSSVLLLYLEDVCILLSTEYFQQMTIKKSIWREATSDFCPKGILINGWIDNHGWKHEPFSLIYSNHVIYPSMWCTWPSMAWVWVCIYISDRGYTSTRIR